MSCRRNTSFSQSAFIFSSKSFQVSLFTNSWNHSVKITSDLHVAESSGQFLVFISSTHQHPLTQLISPLVPEILSSFDFRDTAFFWLVSCLTVFFVFVSFGGGARSSSCLSFGVSWLLSLGLFSFLSILTVYLLSYSFVALNIYTLMTPNFYILVLASPLNSFLSNRLLYV